MTMNRSFGAGSDWPRHSLSHRARSAAWRHCGAPWTTWRPVGRRWCRPVATWS